MIHTHTHTCEQFLYLHDGLGLDFVFACLLWFSIFYVFFIYFSLDHVIPVLLAFDVGFSFFGAKPRDWLGRTSPKLPIPCQVGGKN